MVTGPYRSRLRMIVPSSHYTRVLGKAGEMLSGLLFAIVECKVLSLSPIADKVFLPLLCIAVTVPILSRL